MFLIGNRNCFLAFVYPSESFIFGYIFFNSIDGKVLAIHIGCFEIQLLVSTN